MKRFAVPLLVAAAVALVPVGVRVQEPGYPMTLIPIAKGPFDFPQGYQIPWDKIEIRVTEKMSPNLFVLHGSQGLDPAHPDASAGGRCASAPTACRWSIPRTGRSPKRHWPPSARSRTDRSRSSSTRTSIPITRAPMRSSRAGRVDLRAGEPAERDGASAVTRQPAARGWPQRSGSRRRSRGRRRNACRPGPRHGRSSRGDLQ